MKAVSLFSLFFFCFESVVGWLFLLTTTKKQTKVVSQRWSPAGGILGQIHTFRNRDTRRSSCVKMLLCPEETFVEAEGLTRLLTPDLCKPLLCFYEKRLLEAPLFFSLVLKAGRHPEGKAEAISVLANVVDRVRHWLFSIILMLCNKINKHCEGVNPDLTLWLFS